MKPRLLIFILVSVLWSLSLYFYNNPVLVNAEAWIKIIVSLTIITVFTLFYFITASKNLLQKFKIPLVVMAIVCSATILTLFINDLFGIESYLLKFAPETTIFFLMFFVYFSLMIAILFEKFFSGSTLNRLEAIYTLTVFAVFVIIITTVYVFLPIIDESKEYLWLGPLLTAVFFLFFVAGYHLIKKTGEESKKKEEAEKLAEEWKKLNEAKDQFLLSLQHHLRTPLTPFKIYLERILDGTYGREENPVIKEKLIEMKKLINTLYYLIESLLDVQELKIGKQISAPEDCRIKSLIEGIIEELKPQTEEKGLYLVFEPSEQEKIAVIKTDKKRTREALWNLIDNAIKYTLKGGVTIKLKLAETSSHLAPRSAKPSSAIENSILKIMVSDTGIGMAKEEIEKFLKGELFSRGEEAKKLYGPGRGIGLTIASEFIKAQGGKIWAESEGRNKGTTFWIELPIK